jgi:hypothetical protein
MWLAPAIAQDGAEHCAATGNGWERCDCYPDEDPDCAATASQADCERVREPECSARIQGLTATLPAGSSAKECRDAYFAWLTCFAAVCSDSSIHPCLTQSTVMDANCGTESC